MDENKKNNSGAPSSDTTSALFVSARKKQLEQQETERRAKEKEDQRLAAEAEVRRLEKEVEERRRKAEEDARLADEEARRIAKEAQLKKAQAAEDPDSFASKPQKNETKTPKAPKQPKPPKQENAGNPGGGLMQNKKMLAVAGGGAALILLVIVLALSLGKKSLAETASGFDFTGVWYDMDYADAEGSYEFLDGGKLNYYYMDDEAVAGTYKVKGEDISCKISGDSFVLTPDGDALMDFDNNMRLLNEVDYFTYTDETDSESYEEEEAPEGYNKFVDSLTGLQFFYQDGLETSSELDSFVREITTVSYEGGAIFFLDITKDYDDLLEIANYSEDFLARIMSNIFLEQYSQDLYGTDWSTAYGTKDFSQGLDEGVAQHFDAVEGEYFDTPSQLISIVNLDAAEVGVYGAVHAFHDSDLKLFTFMVWYDTESDQSVLEQVLSTMKIAAVG